MTQRLPGLLLLLVLGVTAALYLPVLSADFVGLDDNEYVRANALVSEPDIVAMFSPQTLTLSDWTPVVTLSHALEYALWGFDARGYHAVNLALHLLSLVLLYQLLGDLGFSPRESLLVTLLFGIHPLQVESVAWISSRKNLLAASFGLVFCRLYLAGRLPHALVALLLALASKGTAVLFPAWAIAATLLGFGQLRSRRVWPWWVGFAVLAVTRAAMSTTAQAAVVGAGDTGTMTVAERMSIMGRVFTRQLRQFFLPYDLSVVYFWGPASWSSGEVLLPWVLVIVAAGVLVWLGRRDRRIALAALLLALALLPTANLVPAPAFQADRYAHLALAGASLLLVLLLRPLYRVRAGLVTVVLAAWCGLVLVPYGRERIAAWRNTEALWSGLLRDNPSFLFGWNSLAGYYLERGDVVSAEPVLRRILTLQPTQLDARLNLALLLANRGEGDGAEAEFQTLVAQHPDAARARAAYAHALSASGRSDEALRQLDRALQLEPDSSPARYQRARLRAAVGDLDGAAADYAALSERSQAALLRSGLAAVRLAQGQVEEALSLAREATRRNPQQAEGWAVLSRALAAAGNTAEADEAAARARQLEDTAAAERPPTAGK